MAGEVEERLDKIVAILQLAFADPLATARSKVAADPIGKAVLAKTGEDWVAGSGLVASVMTASGKGRSAVYAKLGELVAAHILIERTVGRATEYRQTGVI